MTKINLTQSEQEALIQAGGDETAAVWLSGDVTLRVIGNYLSTFPAESVVDITMTEVYEACGDMCGKSAETMRKRAELAAFYPPDLREAYSGLYISHFSIAMRAGDRAAASEWLYVALFSADDYGGKPMPARVLAMKVKTAAREGDGLPSHRNNLAHLKSHARWLERKARSMIYEIKTTLDLEDAGMKETWWAIDILDALEALETNVFESVDLLKEALDQAPDLEKEKINDA